VAFALRIFRPECCPRGFLLLVLPGSGACTPALLERFNDFKVGVDNAQLF
jgi:hypothetical protein